MLAKNTKYYLVTYNNIFYRVEYVKAFWSEELQFMIYNFRSSRGDLFFYHKDDNYVNFITENFEELKMELVKRLYRGIDIRRSPFDNVKLLNYYVMNFPERFI